ncbi:TPA: hypothetical protein SMF28_000447 [Serratia marcescens]|nr:hypothetical protein [Serratia marcescens]HEJ9034487.1 hypothetical protein [Serratia marcescens]HEJ9090793.1 hypothetical protein [Serratia marcescens]
MSKVDKQMTFDKPHIKFDPLVKIFYCECIKDIPGERCLIVGRGKTPIKAFKDWQLTGKMFETGSGVL